MLTHRDQIRGFVFVFYNPLKPNKKDNTGEKHPDGFTQFSVVFLTLQEEGKLALKG